MATYIPTAFDGTNIVTSSSKIVDVEDTTFPVVRMGRLPNGAIFDADGTADATVGLGQITATYRVIAPANGMVSLNTAVTTLTALEGKEGTLTGKAYATGGDETKTCTARCISVVAARMGVYETPPATATTRMTRLVTMTWQKKTEWAS